MTADASNQRIVHLSNAPEETYLLGIQLQEQGLGFQLTSAPDRDAMERAIGAGASLVVADLPLAWAGADDDVARLQRTRPDLPVVFRWGGAGTWSAEEGGAQLARSVRSALSLSAAAGQEPDERRRALLDVVRFQSAHLRLAQLPTEDCDAAIRTALETMADTARVDRVSVWRLDRTDHVLRCEALYSRNTGAHQLGAVLPVSPAYEQAIEAATFVAAHDAVRDPRTSDFADHYLIPLGISSMLDAPIRTGGQVVGVICLEHTGEPRQWTVIEQCAASAFAAVIGRLQDARLRQRLEAELDVARRLDLLGNLSGAIAHDLSNFAQITCGFAEMLLSERSLSPSMRGPLESIRRAGMAAHDVVQQLLCLARKAPEGAGPVDVVAAVLGARPLLERLLGPHVALTLTLPEGPVWASLGLSQLHRVILNLAANARDAQPSGGRFELSLEVPSVPEGVSTTSIRLRARDHGPGIPADVLPRIFDPLFTTKSDGRGTGLGLSAVRAIVDKANGRIDVVTDATGTCFDIALPLTVAPAAHTGPSALPAASNAVILLVDDSEDMLGLMRRVLWNAGHSVQAATSAASAIDLAATLERVDVVVISGAVGTADGVACAARIRARHSAVRTLLICPAPALVSTVSGVPRALVLSEPFANHQLVERVRDLLNAYP